MKMLWIIVAILILPFMSETIYTPSLPDIADHFDASGNMVQYTLTIYLFAFACGVLTWGNLSDTYGRRPMVLTGYGVYVFGCLLCSFAPSLEILFIGRFIQAFGGAVGSVLGQAIARDYYSPKDRGAAFATIGMCIGFAPAIGPVLGGYTDQYFGWEAVFWLLAVMGGGVFALVQQKLVETKPKSDKKRIPIMQAMTTVITDPQVLGYGALVGCANGMMFGYYAEAPFIFIDILGLLPGTYGTLFIFVAIAFIGGAAYSRRLHHKGKHPLWTVGFGTAVMTVAAILFLVLGASGLLLTWPKPLAVGSAFSMILLLQWGMAVMIPNCLSNALENYGHMAGTAASVFGFYYYVVVSALTFVLGTLHNGTLWMLPTFFTVICLVMLMIWKRLFDRIKARDERENLAEG